MRRAMEEMQKPQSEQGALLESDRQVSGQPSLSGKDIRATLAISTAEALHGTSRMLTLPGGRRVTVVVPVGAYDGQIIRLEGQGDPSSSGGSRGALILTLAIHPTVLARNPNLQQPTAGYSQDTPLQSPYPNNPYTQSLYPPPYAGYAPGRNTQPPPSYPPPPPPPSVSTRLPAQLREHRIPQRRQGCRAILLIGLALVVIAACAGLFAVLRSHQVANNPAAATAIAPQNIYTQATSGTPAFNDPLSHQDSSNWDVGTSNGKDCAFIGGAYHVKSSSQPCFAQASNFSNFALQVQMTIIKGNSGGIIFRAHLGSTNTSFYFFSIGQDGSYVFGTTQIGSSSGTSKLVFSSQGNMNAAAAIKHGLNQTNLITIVARGSDIYLFVNKHYIDHISDSTLNSGKIGVFANATSHTTISFGSGNPTDVAFSNAQIWIF